MDTTPIETYDQLIQALRNRICELGIILDTIDQIAGLAPRYASKLLSNEPVKHFGAISLFPVLQALGLRMRLEPNDEAIAKLSKRSDWQLTIRNGPRYRPRYDRRKRISSTAPRTATAAPDSP